MLQICAFVAIMACVLKTLWQCYASGKAWLLDIKTKKAEKKNKKIQVSATRMVSSVQFTSIFFTSAGSSVQIKTEPQMVKDGGDSSVFN